MVALQIRGLREKRGWTQEELAKHAGLHQTQIANVENLKWSHDPTVNTLRKVAEAFDVALKIRLEQPSPVTDEASK